VAQTVPLNVGVRTGVVDTIAWAGGAAASTTPTAAAEPARPVRRRRARFESDLFR
jgi:hypothetical protein